MWSHTDDVANLFYSPFMGNAQRLPYGNTHITESSTGRLFEVTPVRPQTPQDSRVVEYRNADTCEPDLPRSPYGWQANTVTRASGIAAKH